MTINECVCVCEAYTLSMNIIAVSDNSVAVRDLTIAVCELVEGRVLGHRLTVWTPCLFLPQFLYTRIEHKTLIIIQTGNVQLHKKKCNVQTSKEVKSS